VSTRITTGMTQRNVLADLNRVTERLTITQAKISSGRDITRPSDDPFNTSRALTLRTAIDGTKQYQRNIQDAQGWQESAELALKDMTEAVHRALELVVQGASDTAPQQARDSIAAEIDQLVEGIKQAGNATYRGRFVFAGTATDAAPFADTPVPYVPAADQYQGSPNAVIRQIGPGVELSIGIVGRDVLGDGPAANDDKLLDVLRDVAVNLRAGNSAALRTDLGRLDGNIDQILAVRALNGGRQNRLDAALTRLTEVEESSLKQLSETEDVDIAKALIDFNSQQAAYQAALKAGANIVQTSLMDFLR
jgi:flagellar hook-associated protein 3 FlgL